MTGFLDSRANLAGKTAVVVGGGGGIGAACTLALAQAGVTCAICDIDDAAMAATRQALTDMGRLVLASHADASDEAALDAFYDDVAASTDRLDIVVNVAGGTHRRAFAHTNRAENLRDVRRNFLYVVQSVERAVPLIARGVQGGSIVNFTTIEAHRGAAGFSVYAGAKAATSNFTRAMAVELAAQKIRLNCVVPDTTFSKGNVAALPADVQARMGAIAPEHQGKGLEMYVPLKAAPSADALADAVLFLASDLSASITGMPIHVDGGTMAAAGFLDWPFGDGYLPVPLAGTLRAMFGSEAG